MSTKPPVEPVVQRIGHFVETVFRTTSSETQDAFRRAAKATYIQHGAVFVQGETARSIAIVGRGYVKLVQAIDLVTTPLAIRPRYSIVGEDAIAYPTHRTSVVAINAELVLLPINTVRFRLDADNNLRDMLLRLLIDRHRDTAELALRQKLDAPGRLADWLLRNCDDVPPVSHNDLAELAGISRQTATKEICKLESAKIIRRDGRRITVIDRDGLLQRARRAFRVASRGSAHF